MGLDSPSPSSDRPVNGTGLQVHQHDDEPWTHERIRTKKQIPGTWLMRMVEEAERRGFSEIDLQIAGITGPDTSVQEFIAALRRRRFEFIDVFPQRIHAAEERKVSATVVQLKEQYARFCTLTGRTPLVVDLSQSK